MGGGGWERRGNRGDGYMGLVCVCPESCPHKHETKLTNCCFPGKKYNPKSRSKIGYIFVVAFNFLTFFRNFISPVRKIIKW